MPDFARIPTGNRLLAALPRRDRLHFLAECDEVDLVTSDVLFEAGDRIRYAHFPVTAYVSLVVPADGWSGLEVGIVGNEGMAGTPLILGFASSPMRGVVQGGGRSLRVDAGTFRRALRQCPALARVLDRYLFVRMTQLAQSALCTRFHLVEGRLAALLLINQDRAHASSLRMTHDSLASKLGVRREGVTTAAGSLQRHNLIRYHRGEITVLDRAGLTKVCCGCHRANSESYSQVFG